IMLYLRMCLAHSAGATPMSTRLLDMQDDAPAIGRYVHTLLSAEPQPSVPKGLEANPVHVYMDLLQQLVSASPETQHGAILALGYMVGRNLSRKKVMASSLGEIGRNGTLLIPAEGEGFTKLSIVENLLARITSGKESIKAKQVELQFTVGEAITSAAIGTCSGAARDPWTCTEDQYSPPHSEAESGCSLTFTCTASVRLSSPSSPHPTFSFYQGAAFGFHMIAAKAGEQLAPFLPQLVPRLYRYQFDPNLSIRQAMTSIWDALTLVKISKTAGARLKPHAARLIPALLEALSTLEPQVLNYLSLRATEQEKCLQHLDVSVLGELIPRLCELLKSGVGLGTKSPCALTLHAISHYSPDVLKAHAGVALPLAFLGMHQAPGPDEEKGESHDATLWSEVWQENVPGSFGGIRLYMTELITITQKALQSQSWKMKAQGAAAMATVAKEQTGSLVAPHLGLVLTALMQGLSGRTWAGKVSVALIILDQTQPWIQLFFCAELRKPCSGQPTIPEVLDVVLKECRKENLVYKMAALRCAGDVLHSSQEDRFSDMADILFPLIKKVQVKVFCLS
ncbi:hypothetical protein XENOCAPTIV_021913, partial [Xenoophorus captivus]